MKQHSALRFRCAPALSAFQEGCKHALTPAPLQHCAVLPGRKRSSRGCSVPAAEWYRCLAWLLCRV